jgi:hypothetical protein
MTKLKNLIIDGNAVLYKYFFGYKKYDIDDIIAVAHVNTLYKIQYLANRYKVDNIVVVFDCFNKGWRKVYTSNLNPEKVTHRPYKAGRRENLSPSDEKKLKEFDASIHRYVDFFKTQTSVLCLQGNSLEGDDLIAGYVRRFPNDDHIIYSSDKDFMQLINSITGTVTLVESQNDTERSLEDWNNDPELFLFEKCFRGEPRGGDNVQNAYPRLLKKKIFAAYEDDYLKNNIFNNTFVVTELDDDDNVIEYNYRTGDLFKENKLLMGLNHQPDYIKGLIDVTIDEGIKDIGKFNYVQFLRFCKQHGMDAAIKEKEKFIDVLSRPYRLSSSGSLSGAASPQKPSD